MMDEEFIRWKLGEAERNLKKARKNVIKYRDKIMFINLQLKAVKENNKKEQEE